jgi:AcrR family transcriptional regulator
MTKSNETGGNMKPTRQVAKSGSEAARLNRDDWLDAAFKAVVEGGFDAARVLVLADKLGVTRGSFYWHFIDHAELISALLARWQARELESGRSLAAELSGTAQDDLERVLDFALAHAGVDLENMRFELALRGMGRRDTAVAEMLAAVDQTRLKLFEQKFMRLTGDAQTSTDLATLFYLAIVGSNQALARPANPKQLKPYLKSIITRYLVQGQVPVVTEGAIK